MARGSRLSIMWQGRIPDWGLAFPCVYAKVVNPGDHDPFPDKRTIVRHHLWDDGLVNEMIWKGVDGARSWWYDGMQAACARTAWAWAIEQANEGQPAHPAGVGSNGLWTYEFRMRYNDWTMEATRLMHGDGHRVVGLCWGVGWPHWGTAIDFQGSFECIDYWGPHEYNAPHLRVLGGNGVACWLGRSELIADELWSYGCRVPQRLLGELGIDLGVWTPENTGPRPEHGWQAVDNNPAHYAEQLQWADQHVLQKPGIEAAFIFVGSPYEPWQSGGFGVTEELATLLTRYQAMNPPGLDDEPPIEEPVAGPRIRLVTKLLPRGPDEYPLRSATEIDTLVLHHSSTQQNGGLAYLQQMAHYFVDHASCPGLPWHYVISGDGEIYKTNLLTDCTLHAGQHNSHTAAICLLGRFDGDAKRLGIASKRDPTPEQIDSLKWLVWYLRDRLDKDELPLVPHKKLEGQRTRCPGDLRRAWWQEVWADLE